MAGAVLGIYGNTAAEAIYPGSFNDSAGDPLTGANKYTFHFEKGQLPPVNAFWSVSVYNAKGYYEKNSLNAYTINNITAKTDADGSVAIQFGGCDGKIPNCLPITKGWNYTVRLYRPKPEILGGKWKFPQPQAT